MTYDTIRIGIDTRGVATLTLSRPDKHNAMNAALMDELAAATTALGEDDAVRVVVLAGEGKSFSAGADLGWMREQFEATRAQRVAEARRLALMLKALNEMPKPLIGRIHGNAFGGGLGLMSICDVAIAAEAATFGFTETRLGIIPATISPFVLARMGEGRARQVFMSARIFGAAEARELGLLARVVPEGALDDAIAREVEPYLAAAPSAVARAKALARTLGPTIDDALIDATIERLADAWETSEAREGITAFFERRNHHGRKSRHPYS